MTFKPTSFSQAARLRVGGLALLFGVGLPPAQAQYAGAKRVPEKVSRGFAAIATGDARRIVGDLAGPKFQGRNPAEPGFTAAAEYAADYFRKNGLQPAGENNSFFQNVSAEATRLDIQNTKLETKDGAFKGSVGRDFFPENRRFSAQASAVPAFLRVPKGADYKKLDLAALRGKLLVVRADETDNTDFGKFAREEAGAAAVIFVQEMPEAKGPVGAEWHSRLKPATAPSAPKVLFLRLSASAAEKLARACGAAKFADKNAKEPTLETGAQELTANVRVEKRAFQTMNVLAKLEGSDSALKAEAVALGAHLDHLGPTPSGIGYGADDNASGSAAVMLIAKAMAQNPVRPRRTVLFMLWTLEESGLFGSQYYTGKPTFPLDKTVAYINLDMVGRNEENEREKASDNVRTLGLVSSRDSSLDLHDLMVRTNDYINFDLEYDKDGFAGASDQASFASKNVPVAFLFSGIHRDYHRPSDTPDKINYTKLTNAAKLAYLAAFEISDRSARIKPNAGGSPAVASAPGPGRGPGGMPATPPKPGELKKYEDVITKEAKTSKGLFAVHRIDDRYFFEIPKSLLGRDMLWAAEFAKVPSGTRLVGPGWGIGDLLVHWERRENKIYLRVVPTDKRGDGKGRLQRALEDSTIAPIMMTFNVETESKDKDPVINVTGLLSSDNPQLSIRGPLGIEGYQVQAIDPARSYVESVNTFPTNIETRTFLSFTAGGGGGARSASVLVHHSLVLLPEKPMQARYFDNRVGYFARSFSEYSESQPGSVDREFINRYRLEKKDPNAALSEPVKPIVYYVAREVPEKWRKYVKQGIEDWNVAFEAAGFKNAIQAKDAPSEQEDPNWDAEDARYSVIRWLATPFANAMGPNLHDPRSGEIISAHVLFWHEVLKLFQQYYYTTSSATDPRAQKLPFPDELIGEITRYVVAHEVGHTLGLRHNHKASSAYTIAQLRDPAFCEKHGTVASIMAYGRFNYVAQPEDKVKCLIPKIGPYDIFAIEWGYRPLGDKGPEAEKPELDKLAARQLMEPWLRFGGEDGPAAVDPTVKAENIGDDSIEATRLGLKNLDRAADMLVGATTKLGEDYATLQETYRFMLGTRTDWLFAVVQMVGGVVETRYQGGRSANQFNRVPKAKQREAVKFLLDHGFSTPKKLLQPAIINRIKYTGVADDVMNQHAALLRNLLSQGRMRRLTDYEITAAPGQAYTIAELIADVQAGLFRELETPQPRVDIYRRGLQRAYIAHLKGQLAPPGGAGQASSAQDSDFRAMARGSLKKLLARLDAAIPKAQDETTRLHLQDCRNEVDLTLDPKR